MKKGLRELIEICSIVRYAAFKRRRINNEENPTDWTEGQTDGILRVFGGQLLLTMSGTLRQWQLAGVARKMEQKMERWAKRLKGETADGNGIQ